MRFEFFFDNSWTCELVYFVYIFSIGDLCTQPDILQHDTQLSHGMKATWWDLRHCVMARDSGLFDYVFIYSLFFSPTFANMVTSFLLFEVIKLEINHKFFRLPSHGPVDFRNWRCIFFLSIWFLHNTVFFLVVAKTFFDSFDMSSKLNFEWKVCNIGRYFFRLNKKYAQLNT